MKKIFLLLSVVITTVSSTSAQDQKIKFSAGPLLAIPTYNGITSTGIGGGAGLHYFVSKKISGIIDVSFTYFKGDVLNNFTDDTVKGFTIMPVLAGAKYFITNLFYLSASTALVIGLHNAGNHLALSPGAGIEIPVSSTSGIDLGLKLIGVPTGYSFSENSFLNKGGYSFLTFRIAYLF
jgi:hypothetical protein